MNNEILENIKDIDLQKILYEKRNKLNLYYCDKNAFNNFEGIVDDNCLIISNNYIFITLKDKLPDIMRMKRIFSDYDVTEYINKNSKELLSSFECKIKYEKFIVEMYEYFNQQFTIYNLKKFIQNKMTLI